jgi:nucleoside-diphosphate-sugar epimerase
MVEGGDCKRQPVLDLDIALGVFNMILMEETKGNIYELGGPHTYRMKELMEYLGNILKHRPKYIELTYDECMKYILGPNKNFEV